MTFEQIARFWHARKQAGWAEAHAADVLASLERAVVAPIVTAGPGITGQVLAIPVS